MRFTRTMILSGGAMLSVLLAQSAGTQETTRKTSTDWPMYRHDPAGTDYSPLAQIDTRNVANLSQVWTYGLQSDAPAVPTGRGGGPGVANSEATPIVVNGVMYLPAVNRIVALEPETGKDIWQYVLTEGPPQRRGVTYWPGDANNAP